MCGNGCEEGEEGKVDCCSKGDVMVGKTVHCIQYLQFESFLTE